MRKWLFAALVLGIGWGSTLSAQIANPNHEDHRKERMQKLEESLNLTDAQGRQIKTIMDKYHEKREELKNSDLSLDDRRATMKELQNEQHQEVKSVLNKEQNIKLDELHKKHEKRGMKKGKRGKKKCEHHEE